MWVSLHSSRNLPSCLFPFQNIITLELHRSIPMPNDENIAPTTRSPVGNHVWPQVSGLSLLEQVERTPELTRLTEDRH